MPKIAVIPGDGIGVEVIRQATKVLEVLDLSSALGLKLVEWNLGAERYLESGIAITEREMEELQSEYDAILLGALGDPRVPDQEHARQILLGLRFQLDLYINLRPVRSLEPSLSPLKGLREGDLDLIIFRENTEGPYAGLGGNFKEGTEDEVAIEEDINTRKGVERIIRAAFQYARGRGRRQVTLADKANAMRFAGSLWRRVFQEIGAEYPEIERRVIYIDALAQEIVLRPREFDIIVTSNLFGDIISDLAAALAGGLGIAPSANLHPGRPGLFEPVHGSAPDLAGRDRANPLAAIMTSALMLEELGYQREADLIDSAIRDSIESGRTTPDLGGELGTEAVGDWIAERIATI